MSCQLDASAALPSGSLLPVPIEKEVGGGAPETVWLLDTKYLHHVLNFWFHNIKVDVTYI